MTVGNPSFNRYVSVCVSPQWVHVPTRVCVYLWVLYDVQLCSSVFHVFILEPGNMSWHDTWLTPPAPPPSQQSTESDPSVLGPDLTHFMATIVYTEPPNLESIQRS